MVLSSDEMPACRVDLRLQRALFAAEKRESAFEMVTPLTWYKQNEGSARTNYVFNWTLLAYGPLALNVGSNEISIPTCKIVFSMRVTRLMMSGNLSLWIKTDPGLTVAILPFTRSGGLPSLGGQETARSSVKRSAWFTLRQQ